MTENHISEDLDFPEDVEICVICGKEIGVGNGRFRTNDGVFCINCYKISIGLNGRHRKHNSGKKEDTNNDSA